MAAERMQFPRRWNGGTISQNLGVIWEMSVQGSELAGKTKSKHIEAGIAPANL
jgi:hypothetical protein